MVVSLNRPEKFNALNGALYEELIALTEALQTDVETRVVIITGEGRHFCVGADVTNADEAKQWQAATRMQKQRYLKSGPRTIRCIQEIDQITIAAINGTAMGGGACIVSACDFRIGADNCRVGFPEVGLGMNLMWVALPPIVHLVGPARAKQMVIQAKRYDADKLLDWGFLDEVVPAEQLLDRASETAAIYAAQPPIGAQMVKRSVNMISSALDQAIMHMDTDQYLFATSSKDHQEAMQAFLEKRPGIYLGD